MDLGGILMLLGLLVAAGAAIYAIENSGTAVENFLTADTMSKLLKTFFRRHLGAAIAMLVGLGISAIGIVVFMVTALSK